MHQVGIFLGTCTNNCVIPSFFCVFAWQLWTLKGLLKACGKAVWVQHHGMSVALGHQCRRNLGDLGTALTLCPLSQMELDSLFSFLFVWLLGKCLNPEILQLNLWVLYLLCPTAAPCLGWNCSFHPSVSLCRYCPDYIFGRVFIFATENISVSFPSMSRVREGWQLFQALFSAAFVAYSSPHMVVFPVQA